MKRASVVCSVTLLVVACGGGAKAPSSAVDWPKVCAAGAERAKRCPDAERLLEDKAGCEGAQKCYGDVLRPEALEALGACLAKGCGSCEPGRGVERTPAIVEELATFEKACRERQDECKDFKCDEIAGSEGVRALRSDLRDKLQRCFEKPRPCAAVQECVRDRMAGPLNGMFQCMLAVNMANDGMSTTTFRPAPHFEGPPPEPPEDPNNPRGPSLDGPASDADAEPPPKPGAKKPKGKPKPRKK